MNDINIPLVNKTGLSASDYTIYVLGFSPTSKKYLSVDATTKTGSFTTYPSESGSVPAYKLGTEITNIEIKATPLDTGKNKTVPKNDIDGARMYFFIAENSTFPSAPSVTYSAYGAAVVNVANPPNTTVPPYTFAEFTLVSLTYGAVIDSQTVDGFVFPVTIEVTADTPGKIGQPLVMTRKDILAAYAPFIKSLGSSATAFASLQYSKNKGGLLNPGAYLGEQTKTGEYVNLESALNTMFDADLNTFFADETLSIQGVAKGAISADVYTATSGQKPLPGSGIMHQALEFKGATNGQSFNIFNPVGLCVCNTTSGSTNAQIRGTILTRTLTFETPLPKGTPIATGMYASGAGIPAKVIYVTKVNASATGTIESVDFGLNLGVISTATSYKFSATADLKVSTSYSGTIDTATLTFSSPVPAGKLTVGMYVGGGTIPGNVQIETINTNAANEVVSVILQINLLNPAAKSQYLFSKVNTMFLTSGNMVLANHGVFAYSDGVAGEDAQTVILNLQNQIVTAFNRGVAILAPSSGDAGYTTKYWGTQTNWYPKDAVQNLFSLFMHTGALKDGTPIFIQAPNSTTNARGTKMGQSYGFAYDENAGPVPPAPTGQPEVPSKYDPLPQSTTEVKITLGPWGA